MKKLKVMAAACGLVVGLTGVAQAALTQYNITGTVVFCTDTASTSNIFSATVLADPVLNADKVSSVSLNYGGAIYSFDTNTLNAYTNKLFTDTPFVLSYSNTSGMTINSIALNSQIALEQNGTQFALANISSITPTPTPIPAAAWLLGSGLLGMVGLKRRKSAEA